MANDAPPDDRWRNLGFEETQARFESASQNARVWSEGWVADRLFCPNCGHAALDPHPANRPVADFLCAVCHEDYELKAQKGRFGRRVVDGALRTMTERLAARDNPNLILMNYDLAALSVTNLIVVPKHFFTLDLIEPRPPLGPAARRAGWQGCNILVGDLPEAGRIWLIRDRQPLSREHVLERWRRTLFLREAGEGARGWLIEVMKCVEGLGRAEFALDDVYALEPRLAALYPANRNVRPKIRQQLQVLRDAGYLEFTGRGRYRVARSSA